MLLQDYSGGSGGFNTKIRFSYAGVSTYASISTANGLPVCVQNGKNRATTLNVAVSTDNR